MPEVKEKVIPFKLADLQPVTHNTKRFYFPISSDIKFEFLPGDHIKVYPDPGDLIEWRQYSPTTTPDVKDHFELIIKDYPDGIVSRYMHSRKVGDDVWISGPHEGGHFVEGMANHVGMVAGGTGITPIISMIRTIMKRKINIDVSLVFANKTEEDIILKDEFDKYAKDSPNFRRYYIVDQAPANWSMGKGHINSEIMKTNLPAPSEQTVIFLCGPPVMELNLREQLIQLGYGPKQIINP